MNSVLKNNKIATQNAPHCPSLLEWGDCPWKEIELTRRVKNAKEKGVCCVFLDSPFLFFCFFCFIFCFLLFLRGFSWETFTQHLVLCQMAGRLDSTAGWQFYLSSVFLVVPISLCTKKKETTNHTETNKQTIKALKNTQKKHKLLLLVYSVSRTPSRSLLTIHPTVFFEIHCVVSHLNFLFTVRDEWSLFTIAANVFLLCIRHRCPTGFQCAWLCVIFFFVYLDLVHVWLNWFMFCPACACRCACVWCGVVCLTSLEIFRRFFDTAVSRDEFQRSPRRSGSATPQGCSSWSPGSPGQLSVQSFTRSLVFFSNLTLSSFLPFFLSSFDDFLSALTKRNTPTRFLPLLESVLCRLQRTHNDVVFLSATQEVKGLSL